MKWWRECGFTLPLVHYEEEGKCRLVQPLCKTVWHYFLKLNTDIPHDPVIPNTRFIPQRNSCIHTPGDI